MNNAGAFMALFSSTQLRKSTMSPGSQANHDLYIRYDVYGHFMFKDFIHILCLMNVSEESGQMNSAGASIDGDKG